MIKSFKLLITKPFKIPSKKVIKSNGKRLLFLSVLVCSCTTNAAAQDGFKDLEHLFTVPLNYVVSHTNKIISADGNLKEPAWEQAKWSSDFVDIEGVKKPLPKYKTQFKMLWNDSTLFIAAKIEEPQVWATLKNHDDIIFHDNDFEVFIDPMNTTHHYFEIEINAYNKIFDLFLNKPYRNTGDALTSWDVAGLKHGVQVKGTINNPKDKDKEWTVELAIPLKSLSFGMTNQLPKDGALWRINFSRVQWETHLEGQKIVRTKGENNRILPENNWVWSPQGVINMHFPERWGYLQFSTDKDKPFILPIVEKQKTWLWLIYYRQKEYFNKNHRYALQLADLNIIENPAIEGVANVLKMEATSQLFNAQISDKESQAITINQEGLIQINTKR
jgi:hypothetical protein